MAFAPDIVSLFIDAEPHGRISTLVDAPMVDPTAKDIRVISAKHRVWHESLVKIGSDLSSIATGHAFSRNDTVVHCLQVYDDAIEHAQHGDVGHGPRRRPLRRRPIQKLVLGV